MLLLLLRLRSVSIGFLSYKISYWPFLLLFTVVNVHVIVVIYNNGELSLLLAIFAVIHNG